MSQAIEYFVALPEHQQALLALRHDLHGDLAAAAALRLNPAILLSMMDPQLETLSVLI